MRRSRVDTRGRESRKRFGQHFLEPAWVQKVVRAIAPAAGDTFIEIGPGRGALTRPLAASARRVVTFEIDRDLAAALRDDAPPNVTVVEGDFLRVPLEELRSLGATADRIRVAGNLPYNVAAPIVLRLLEAAAAGAPLRDATVMLQREVADRLTAPPGTRDYGGLTVLVGQRASTRRVLSLPPGAFRPAPKIHSAVVRLTFHEPEPPARDPAVLAALVRTVFTRRRKMLRNALVALTGSGPDPGMLSPSEALDRAGLDASRRPETLTIAEFVRLADVLTPSA